MSPRPKLPVLPDGVLRVSDVAGRTTFDKKAAEAAGLDLTPYQQTGQPSKRLAWKATKKDDQ